jgi:pseudomonalisin/xanthomonalisin
MSSSTWIRCTGAAVLALATASAFSAKLPSGPWADTATQALAAPEGAALAPVDGSHPVHIVVGLALRGEAALAQRVESQKPGLTRADYLRDHAPAVETVERLVAHLKASGFATVRATPSRRLVEAIGTAADAQRAFQVTLDQYEKDGLQNLVARTAPRLPADLAMQVTSVLGLQTVRLALPSASQQRSARAGADGKSGPGVPRYPQEFEKAYNAQWLPPATGASVGNVGFGYMNWAVEDLTNFAAMTGYPVPATRIVWAGDPSDDKTAAFVWSEDSELALAAAGGQLKETIFYAGWDISDASLAMSIDVAVNENQAQTLMFDLIGDEYLNKHTGWTQTVDPMLKVAAAQGQSFMVVGGNNGSKGCFAWAGHMELDYPAVSPWAIAVAGADLTTNAKGELVRETAWRCAVGGLSGTEPAPKWQTQSGLFGDTKQRAIPDVALSTNATIWFDGWYPANAAGISMAVFSGFWARLQNAHGNALGFAGPVLYKTGVNHAEAFFDITKGHNASYSAMPGWDFVSGFGSPDVQAFSVALP